MFQIFTVCSVLDTLKGEKSVTGGIEISSKLQELARKQRMNTDLRRNIFFIIMTSEVKKDSSN